MPTILQNVNPGGWSTVIESPSTLMVYFWMHINADTPVRESFKDALKSAERKPRRPTNKNKGGICGHLREINAM